MGNSKTNIFLPIVITAGNNHTEFFRELKYNIGQRRNKLDWDNCLAEAAKLRALQASKQFSHNFGPDGVNRIVRRICPLPVEYSENGNSIESLIGGVENPKSALQFLLNSPSHADHLLGRNSFFLAQSRAGIGFVKVEGSKYQFYYCILISK